MLTFLLGICIFCCCKTKKSNASTVLGRILLSLPPTLLTTQGPEGIIQPDVMFYTRPPTRGMAPSVAVVARALPPLTAKDRLTTPIMPLNPAYQPSQPVTVTTATTTAGTTSNDLTLPPGYVANRAVKYR